MPTVRIGQRSTGGYENWQTDNKFGFKFQCPVDCTISQLTAWMLAPGSGLTCYGRTVIYDVDQNLLGASDDVLLSWNTLEYVTSFSTPVELVAGSWYWFCTHIEGSPWRYYGDSGTVGSTIDTFSDGPSDPAGFTEATGDMVVIWTDVTVPEAIHASGPEPVILSDALGSGVGVVLANVKSTARLLGTDTLDSVSIPWAYLKSDGTTESRLDQIEDGWYCVWRGHRYIIEDPDTDNETGIEFTARSAETELSNFYTNYSPGAATYLNMLPSALYTAILSGKVGRSVKNAGFGILDTNTLPTNWYHPTGWTSQLVSNRRVWQADAGSEESYSDDIPCTPGVSYRIKVDIAAAGTTGTRGVKFRWIKADGTTVDSAVTNLATEDGAFHATETADVVALGTKLRIVLVTAGTAHTTQFDDVRLYEIGDDTGWTAVATAMDTRDASIPYNDGAIQRYGVWVEAGAPVDRIESTGVGDYVGRVFNGPFVTVNFAAGGAGAQAKIRVNGVVKTSNLNVSSATTYTVSGLDPSSDHIVEVEVAAVKVAFLGFTVSTANLISMRWDHKDIYEAVVSMREAVGGELSFDTINRVITHTPAVGQDLKANNVVQFRRGSNISKMKRTQLRDKLVNRLTGMGYGEGQYQLMVTVDATGTNDAGDTSIEAHGVQRGTYTDKECKSLATMTAKLQRMVEDSCWYRYAYDVEVTDEAAALCVPGDTGHFVYKDINEKLRIVEITRSTDSSTARFKVANIAEDITARLESTRRDLATLNTSYQGVPALQNLSLQGDFDYSYPVECPFFIPYGADLIDLRLRYQIGGMRATAKGAESGGGDTKTTTDGGGTTETTTDGGGTTETSDAVGTPSGGADTTGETGGQTIVLPSIMRSLTTSGTGYDIGLTSTGQDFELVAISIGNFSGSVQSFTWRVGTSMSGGGTKIDEGTATNVANGDTVTVFTSWNTGSASKWYANVEMDSGSGTWLFTASRLGYGKHIHTTPAHTHPDHTHDVTIPDHNHDVTIPSHDHDVTIDPHTHNLDYGINVSTAPTSVRVYLDDALITELNDDAYVSDFDLMPYAPKDSNGRVREGYHTVKVATAVDGQTGRVTGMVFAQQFIGEAA